jgi:hypothetical protein
MAWLTWVLAVARPAWRRQCCGERRDADHEHFEERHPDAIGQPGAVQGSGHIASHTRHATGR